MFEPGKLYRHWSSGDIFYYVNSTPVDEGDTVRVVVSFWNHLYKVFQGETSQVRIKKQDFRKWTEVKENV